MSNEATHKFISIGIPVGASRVTISAPNTADLVNTVRELMEPDENDPDQISPLNYLLEQIETINAAVILKFPQTPSINNSPSAATPQVMAMPETKVCAHGSMKYKEGTSNRNGQPYKGYFCQAPFGQQKCKAIFL